LHTFKRRTLRLLRQGFHANIAEAFTLTSATRFSQPLPNVEKVVKDR
jgi:hypothetical protein